MKNNGGNLKLINEELCSFVNKLSSIFDKNSLTLELERTNIKYSSNKKSLNFSL